MHELGWAFLARYYKNRRTYLIITCFEGDLLHSWKEVVC